MSRESPAIAADRSFSGQAVATLLDKVAGRIGLPKAIQVDNGPELPQRRWTSGRHAARSSWSSAAQGRQPLRLWRLYGQFWLICLVFPLLALVQLGLTLAQFVLVLIGLLIFVASYTWVMWTHPVRSVSRRTGRIWRSALLFVGLTVLVLWLSITYDSAFLWLFVGASAIAGVTFSPRSAFAVVIVLTLLTLSVSLGLSGGITADWLHILRSFCWFGALALI